MLSRVADSLYWMSRYVERAESVARLVDVNLQLMLDIPARQAAHLERNWFPLAACLGEEDHFKKKGHKADMMAVVEHLVFDRSHANSVVGSLSAARENARTTREQITGEMWEQINRAYLWSTSKGARQSFERNRYEFFQRSIKTLQLFEGITDSTMLHAEAWDFIQLGKHLERADKTTRLLDDQFHLLRLCPGADPLVQWASVLRFFNARQTFQRLYGAGIQPERVVELLLLNPAMPQSVLFCLREVDAALRRISGVAPDRFSNRAEQLSGRLLASLTYSRVDELCAQGLHQAMDDLQTRFNEIGSAIFTAYIRHPELEGVETVPSIPVQQQQQ